MAVKFSKYRQHFVRVEYSTRIEHLFDVLHLSHSLGRLGHVDEVALLVAEAVLGRHTAMVVARPLVDERLEHAEERFVELARRHVQVQIAVAKVSVANAAHIAGRGGVQAAPQHAHELVDLLERQRDVVLVVVAVVFERLGEAFAQRPDAVELGARRLGNDRVSTQPGATQLGEERLDFAHVVLATRAVGLGQTVEGGVARHLCAARRPERILQLQVLAHRAHRLGVHELERREDLVELELGQLEDVEHARLERRARARYKNEIARLGLHRTQDRDGRDDAERALGADEELLEIVAGVVLAHRWSHDVQDAAVCEHHLQAEHVLLERAVAQEAQTAGVGGHVAADVAAALGAQVERHHERMRAQVLVKVLEDAAALAAHDVRVRVDGEDAIEALGRDDQLVVDGHTAAHEARVAALRTHGETLLVAVGQNGRELCGVLRQ